MLVYPLLELFVYTSKRKNMPKYKCEIFEGCNQTMHDAFLIIE